MGMISSPVWVGGKPKFFTVACQLVGHVGRTRMCQVDQVTDKQCARWLAQGVPTAFNATDEERKVASSHHMNKVAHPRRQPRD